MRSISIEFVLLIGASLLFDNARAHLAITSMKGETNGLTGKGFGTLDGAPRDGTARDPFQLDTPVIREADINNGIASVCGRTLIGGKIDMADALAKAEDGGLPDVGKEGLIKLIAHQVNADGGGPYSCAVDYTATGEKFEPIEMIMNLPGRNGRSDARAMDLPIHAQMPAGATCKGGADGQTCLVRCLNGAKAGPFGGCMAFTQKQGLFNDPAPAGKGPSPGAYVDPITENPVSRYGDVFHDANAKLEAKAAQGPVTVTPIPNQTKTLNGDGAGGKTPTNGKAKAKKRNNIGSPFERRQAQDAKGKGKAADAKNAAKLAAKEVKSSAPPSNSNLGKLDVMPPTSRIAPPSNGPKTPADTTFGVRRSPQNNSSGKQMSFPEYTISKVGHVESVAPTKEGTLYEISVATLGQADTPRNVRQAGKRRSLIARQQGNPTNPKGLTKEQILQAEKAEAKTDGKVTQGKAANPAKGAKAKLRARTSL